MKLKTKKKTNGPRNATVRVHCAVLSKEAAAKCIVDGVHHVHSTELLDKDPAAVTTLQAVSGGEIPQYSWEGSQVTSLSIVESAARGRVIGEVLEAAKLKSSRSGERVREVLEELITNAIYHGYQKSDGTAKYARRESVKLPESEQLTLRWSVVSNGLYVSVEDRAGTMTFGDVQRSFMRCYGPERGKIEDKESGAGLGLYLIFDSATHVKVVIQPGTSTQVSCWIADKGHLNPDRFSFNFFERGKRREPK